MWPNPTTGIGPCHRIAPIPTACPEWDSNLGLQVSQARKHAPNQLRACRLGVINSLLSRTFPLCSLERWCFTGSVVLGSASCRLHGFTSCGNDDFCKANIIFWGRPNQKTRGISLRTSPVLRLESKESAYGRKYIKLHKKREELQKKNRSVHREHKHNTESIKNEKKIVTFVGIERIKICVIYYK